MLAEGVRDRHRQQHETPPKIWLIAMAASRTNWRGTGDICVLIGLTDDC